MNRMAALVLALSATLALAANRLPVNQVRFSSSGERVMVLSSGVLDGSGFSTARLDILNTATGRTVYRRQITASSETPGPNALRWQLLNQGASRRALAVAGLRPGVVSRARFSRTYPQPFAQWSDAWAAGETQAVPVALWSVPVPVRLEVLARPGPCAHPEWLEPASQVAGFRLMVGTQVVYTDGALPADRRCVTRYALESVHLRGNRALFVVRAYGPGFEGPDAEPVYVAGTLK